MMKRGKTAILALALVCALGLTALAAGAARTISVTPDVKVLVNGETFVPKDATGKTVEIFAYEGTTYAPLRAVAEAFGLKVDYDAAQQAAVIVDPAAQLEVPNPHTEYILQNLPREGDESEVYFDFHWWGFDEGAKVTAKVVSGALPTGITLGKDGTLTGKAAKELEQTVTIQATDGETTIERPVLFRFRPRGVANLAPVVCVGMVGDYLESGFNPGPQGALYWKDDVHNIKEEWTANLTGPLGTQAGLDALAQYGLQLEQRLHPNDDNWIDAEYLISGEVAKGTNGWVKLEIPVYPVYNTGEMNPESPNELDVAFSLVPSQGNTVSTGVAEVYLNLVGF